MKSESRYLLVVSCSQRKRSDPGVLRAIERYDGVNFRVIRKAKREGYFPTTLDVLILSAKYGLLEATTSIENYELRLCPDRASFLQPEVSKAFDEKLRAGCYAEIFINLGKIYLSMLALSEELPLLEDKVSIASGGIGEKMLQMKTWIRGLSC